MEQQRGKERMNRDGIFIIVAAALLGACGSDATIETGSDLAALKLVASSYHEAATAKDREGVIAFYDRNAIMVPPNDDLVENLEGVQNYRFGFIETPGVELDFEVIRAEISASGDIGWTLSIGEITINNPEGSPGRDVVRDFHIWKKQEDGSWKVVLDMWNSELPIDE